MPKKILITYANHVYYHSSQRLIKSAKYYNDFDEYVVFAPWDIDEDFRKQNREILQYFRGDGYWLWKPYIIKKTLERMSEGDILFYVDSGTYFIHTMKPVLDIFNTSSTPVMAFNVHATAPEKEWTKRDCFVKLNLDMPEYSDTHQRCASFNLWRKNEISCGLANEWLSYAQDIQILTDLPSTHPNYPKFKEHRHDQSIFSLLTKKYNLPIFRDLSQFGNDRINEYENSNYPQIIEHNRKKANSLRVKYYLISLNMFIIKCYMFYKKNYGYSIWKYTRKHVPPPHTKMSKNSSS